MLLLLLPGGMGSLVVHAQPDSVRTALLEKEGYPSDHSPRNALWRAAALPGWGQVYNRQYYKLPFVYGGLAGGGYAIYEMNRRYLLYRHANLYQIGKNRKEDEDAKNPYGHFQDDYDEVVAQLGGAQAGSVSGRQLRTLRDKYRRWRDLSILGTGLFYALTVLDAYVSAHLLTFDVGDVALRVRPTGGGRLMAHMEGGSVGLSSAGTARPLPVGAGIRVRMQF